MAKTSRVGIILMIVTCLSKIAALFMTLVFSRSYGANLMTDAYYAASTVPDLINNSLTVCSLTLFVPLYIECRHINGEKATDVFSSSVLNIYFIFNCILAVIVGMCAPLLARIVAPGFSGDVLHYTEIFIVLLSLSFPLTIGTQVLVNICNANRDHIVQTVLTLINHIITIGLMLVFMHRFNLFAYPFYCIVAWLINLILQYCYTKKHFNHMRSFDLKNKYIKRMLYLSIPVIIATAAEQINLAIDRVLSSMLETGSITYLGYSNRIYVAVLGAFIAVLITIYYPVIAEDYNNNKNKLNRDIRKFIDLLAITVMPIVAYCLVGSKYAIKVLYGGGSINDNGLHIVAVLFTIYMIGLFFAGIKELATKLFYVLQETRVPMTINIICVVINVGFSIVLMNIIGIYGIALATTIATFVCALIECIYLIKRIGGIHEFIKRKVINIKNIIQVLLASFLGGVAVFFVGRYLSVLSLHRAMELIITAFAFGLTYGIVLMILKNDYLMELLNRRKI